MTTPSPVAPAACPACQAPIEKQYYIRAMLCTDYECGYKTNLIDGTLSENGNPCTRAFAAAVELRARLEQAEAEREEVQRLRQLTGLLKAASEALAEVQLQIERLASTATRHTNAASYGSDGGDFIEAYTIKTGAFHALLGMVRGGKVSMVLSDLQKTQASNDPLPFSALASGAESETQKMTFDEFMNTHRDTPPSWYEIWQAAQAALRSPAPAATVTDAVAWLNPDTGMVSGYPGGGYTVPLVPLPAAAPGDEKE